MLLNEVEILTNVNLYISVSLIPFNLTNDVCWMELTCMSCEFILHPVEKHILCEGKMGSGCLFSLYSHLRIVSLILFLEKTKGKLDSIQLYRKTLFYYQFELIVKVRFIILI